MDLKSQKKRSELALVATDDKNKIHNFFFQDYIVIGWGKLTNEGGLDEVLKLGVASRLPQKLSLSLVDNNQCNAFFRGINEKHICAGGVKAQDSCNGDSGGPLVNRSERSNDYMTLHGIVSSGSVRCGIGKPGIYTRVSHYIDWIKTHLRD